MKTQGGLMKRQEKLTTAQGEPMKIQSKFVKAQGKFMKMQSFKAFLVAFVLMSGLLAQNALAKPPHEPNFAPHEHLHEKAHEKPHKGARGTFPQDELPHIKGIAPEIFASADEKAQIKALQIEADSRQDTRKSTQKFKDEREKLELNRHILQVKLYHAKAKSDEKLTKDLLRDIYQNEQALSKNKIAERELRDSEELKRVEKIYKELAR